MPSEEYESCVVRHCERSDDHGLACCCIVQCLNVLLLDCVLSGVHSLLCKMDIWLRIWVLQRVWMHSQESGPRNVVQRIIGVTVQYYERATAPVAPSPLLLSFSRLELQHLQRTVRASKASIRDAMTSLPMTCTVYVESWCRGTAALADNSAVAWVATKAGRSRRKDDAVHTRVEPLLKMAGNLRPSDDRVG